MAKADYDAAVIGSGPNGLAAAIALAQQGHSVAVFEAKEQIGGGCRTEELTLPGFRHDVCSAIHPMGASSPFFSKLPLADHGLRWVYPNAEIAHPLDDGTAMLVHRSVADTASQLGGDARSYERIMQPLVNNWIPLIEQLLGPPRPPKHPFVMARFGLRGLWSSLAVARRSFKESRARALFGGLSAHSILPLNTLYTAAFGMMLGLSGHAVGWPFPEGGSQSIADALGSYLQSLGGTVTTGAEIKSMADLPSARSYLFDVSPRVLASIAGDKLPTGYVNKLMKFRHGPGVFKVDFALDGPVPWKAEECKETATLHIGGTLEDIAASEDAMSNGRHADRPFVIAAQQSLFDSTRAPEGKHTLWTYCHVPNGSDLDMTDRIESQIERFAPGFRDLIAGKRTMNCSDYEKYNRNYIGGDISGGSHDGLQLFLRPTFRLNPYTTPVPDIFLCSASTPPGAGVHGMCGFHAARAAIKRIRKSGTESRSAVG